MKNRLPITQLLVAVGLATSANAQEITATPDIGQVGFVRNQGQVKDQYGNAARDVLYLAHVDGIQVQLRRTGFSYQVLCAPEATDRSALVQGKLDRDATVSMERIDLDLALAQSGVPFTVEEGEELPGVLNFVGEKEISGVHHFRSVTFVGAWAGADLLFEIVRSAEGRPRFKYSIIAHEGTSIASLTMNIRGLSDSRVDGATMHMDSEHFGIEERIPESWLINEHGEKVPVQMAYVKGEASATKTLFTCVDRALATVPAGQHLVIDPTPNLQWGVYFGGPGSEDQAYLAVKRTGSGAIAISGGTTSTSGIATAGAAMTTHSGGIYDAFVAIFSSTGTLSWATYFGGASVDVGYGCAFDGSGNVYLCGDTKSTGLSAHGYQGSYAGGYDGFLVKFNSTGARIWSTYYGGTLDDGAYDVATDASGSVYIAGTAKSTGLSSAGAHQTTQNGGSDHFLAKFDTGGNRLWCTYYGGAADELAPSVATDINNNVYLMGSTASANGTTYIIATASAHQPALSTAPDGFLAKFASTGVRQWSTYYGGDDYDRLNDLAVDCYNAIYVVGCTESTINIASTSVYQPTKKLGVDGFFAKFTSSGTRSYGSYYGGDGLDILQSVSVSAPNLVYYAGQTESTTAVTYGSNLWQATHGGGVGDGYVGRFTPAGACVYSTYYGGAGYDKVDGIECFTSGNVVFAGWTSSTSGIATSGSLSGPRDLFIAEFDGPQFQNCGGEEAMPLAPPTSLTERCDLMDDGVIHDPINGTLKLDPTLCTACGLNVYNLSGRLVYTTQVNSDRVTLPDQVRTGPFIVQVVTDQGTCSKVIVPDPAYAR